MISCDSADERMNNDENDANTEITEEVNPDSLVSTSEEPDESATTFVFENTSWINEESKGGTWGFTFKINICQASVSTLNL